MEIKKKGELIKVKADEKSFLGIIRKRIHKAEESQKRFEKTLEGKQLAFNCDVNEGLLIRSAYFFFGVTAMLLLLSSQFSVLLLNLSFLENFNNLIISVTLVIFFLLVAYLVSSIRYRMEFSKWKSELRQRRVKMVSKADLITDYDPFKYLWAYDPVIKMRTVHVIKGKMAVSLVTGHRFKLNENQIKEFKEGGLNGTSKNK